MPAAVLALFSSLLWGTGDFIAGLLSRKRSAYAVAGASQLVGLVLMTVIVLVTGEWRIGWGSYVWWAALASVAGLGGLVMFYLALASGRMGVVSPIAALGVLVPLAVGLVGGESPSGVQLLGILIAVVGVVLASGPEVSGAAGLRPVLLALGAAIGFGLFYVFIAAGSQESPTMVMFAERIWASLLVLGAILLTRSTGDLQRGDAGAVLAIGTLDIGANLAYALAAETGLLSVVSVLGSLYPVVTVLLAWLILRERLAPVQYIGVTVAMVGVVAINAG
jgi:drug/metabolite transporter (DMT)-like permease